ncbi:unnamed protein product [Paramecium octaurelia]|uniref:Transmembrane protein n=1 Tax=Paramecium octaurelia TaxID=43137 RepID=A0A8S1THY9_PAROT|nr:unnamed protein product [Paramecium octaurelia]
MGYLLIDVLSEIAFYKSPSQLSDRYFKVQLLICSLQFLALLFPNDGWNYWNYDQDPVFKYFKQVINCLLILPIQHEEKIIHSIIASAFFAFQSAIIIFISILTIFRKISSNTEFTNGILHFMLRVVNFYFLHINFSIGNLFLLYYGNAIFCAKFNSFSDGKCSQHSLFFIGLAGSMLTIFSQYIGVYLFRSFSFRPFSILQSKYSFNQMLFVLIRAIMFAVYLLETTSFNVYLFFILINCLILLQMIENFFLNAYYPPNNEFNFKLYFILFSVSILITLNVLSENTILQQNMILESVMLAASFSYYFSEVLFERKIYHQSHFKLLSSSRTIDVIQRIYELSQDIKKTVRQKKLFYYYAYIVNHIQGDKHIDNSFFQDMSSRKFIIQFLQRQLKLSKQNGKVSFEDMQLIYTNFLSHYCKKPLLSLVEFRKYDIFYQQQQSYYFKFMKKQINNNLQQTVQKQQQANFFQSQNREQEKQSLDIVHISKSIVFEELYIPNIIKLMDAKIYFWEQLIKGYNTIQEFQNEAINLSKKVQSLQRELLSKLSFDIENIGHLGTNCNVLELKIASIFYSSIMNDYYNSAQCEFLIQEIFNIEHTLSSDVITNFTLVEDKVALIMLSLVRNLGQIINQDKRGLSQYFGYDDKEFQQIQYINQLMPPFLSVIHDNLLEDYLQQAKSKLFQSYNVVFSSDKFGYLVAQQLKIDNNFLIQDDYVIMGCLSQVKRGIDFVIFGDDGKIWGSTQNFFQTYFQNQNEKFTLQRLTNQCYIYMYFPQLIKIIDSYKNQLVKSDYEGLLIEDSCIFMVRDNIIELIQHFQSQSINMPKSSHFEKSIIQKKAQLSEGSLSKKIGTISIQQNDLQEKEQDHLVQIESNRKQSEESIKPGQYNGIPLLNKQYQNEIQQYLESIEEKPAEKFLIKFSLNLKNIGKEDYHRSYFILEIIDVRKKDLIGKSISENQNQQTNDSKFYSLQNNNHNTTQEEEQTKANVSGFVQSEQPYSEIVPVNKDIGCGVTDLLERMGPSKKQKQDQDFGLFNLDSARDSMSYGPLSQRAHFINPNQKEGELEEIVKLDQDFNVLGIQLNSASAIMQKEKNIQYEPEEEFDIEESLKQQKQQIGKSSSDHEKDKKNDILEIMKKNKLKGKNHEEEDVDALKSKSSMTSATSGNSAIQIIKKFQSTTHLTQGLKFISISSLTVFIIIIILITVHLVLITISNQDTSLTINDINGPFILNRSYLEVISFTWSLIVGTLDIIETSQFIKEQTFSDLFNTTSELYDEINNMYLGFIEVEEKGMLSLQKFTFLKGNTEEVKFPYFINLIEGTLDRVVKIVSIEIADFPTLLTREYLDQLFLLRYNLNQIYLMSSELIDSLNVVFLSQTNDRVGEMQTQVIIEIICIGVILLVELYFWKQIQNYSQQLMLLTGRLQESDANESIARASLVKETLTQQSGKYSWKKQNYYALNYQSLNTLNFELLNQQSRIIKDLALKNHFDVNQNKNHQQENNNKKQQSQKRNINVVLSSRIYNTQISLISYTIMLLIVFIIIALMFFGGFLLFSQQISDLGPSQALTGNYIKFTQKLDTLMACALILKTQHLVYDALIEMKVYDSSTINSFLQTNDIVELFSDLSKIYSENLTSIYESILQSNKIKDEDKQLLFTLYQDDFCQELSDEIPMCNIEEFGIDKFTQTFGSPILPQDDNKEYVNKGIVGVISRLDTLFSQFFDYEIEYKQFQPDTELCKEQIDMKEFRNAVFAHFLDTNDGTNTFLDIIYISIYGILDENLSYIYLYYGVVGVLVGLSYAIYYIVIIIKTNNKLIRTRLALITLPISILTEQHTISMLKRLN